MDMQVVKTLANSEDLIDIEHHFKVSAGPGAGKTRWLINHIKNVVTTSKRLGKCRKIACITYTNIGVETINDRLGQLLEHTEVSTIHSFLYAHVVKPYIWIIKDEFNIPVDKIDGHEDFIPSTGFIHKWKEKTGQLITLKNKETKDIVAALCDLQWCFNNNELTLEKRHSYTGQGGSYSIRKNSYIEYKKMCWNSGIVHHDDILYFSWVLFKKSPRVLDIIRSKFPYIFIDEFQDTNPIQTEIIRLLATKETIIGVIGDKGQSIYSFQGACVSDFENFSLAGMQFFKIENNHRSTEKIIDILNFVRNDSSLTQECPDKSNIGVPPIIFVGDMFKAYQKAMELLDTKDIYTLSYRNIVARSMQNNQIMKDDKLTVGAFIDDPKRGYRILNTIYALEYAHQRNIKKALHHLKKIETFTDKNALIFLRKLYNQYSSIKNMSLTNFYNDLLLTDLGCSKINRGKTKDKFYDPKTYRDIASCLRFDDEKSYHTNIHKAKGAEFDNVLVMISDPQKTFNEDKDLSFLFNPNIDIEENRVLYVALSRTKKNLFLSIPSLTSDANKQKLLDIGFQVVQV